MTFRASSFLFFAWLAVGIAQGQTNAASVATDLAAKKLESEAEKAASDARKAAADARKAEADAETAETKAKFGTLSDVTTSGTTAAGDKAGQIEAAILSAETTRNISAAIVSDLCRSAAELCAAPVPPTPPLAVPVDVCAGLPTSGDPPKLYIVAETEKASFDTVETVQAALCGMSRAFTKAFGDSDRLERGSAVPVIGPAGIFTLVNVAGNLFRSDYTIQGVSITPDDLLLAKAITTAARDKIKAPIIIPAAYRPGALSASNPLVKLLAALDRNRTDAVALAAVHRAKAALPANKGKAATAQKLIVDQFDASIKAYDDYIAEIAAPSDKGVSILAEAARQAAMRSDLDAGSYLLTVRMNAAGGSTYTKKNFWTFLGGPPFFVSGGTVASFTLIHGTTGAAAAAGTYAEGGGFESIGALHRRSKKP